MTQPIDLRSDTVTRPTPGMRKFIAEAPVGDDVIDVDPTVERLQQLTAELLGKEAAIFMPSGTMTNQSAVRLHCGPGDELLCDANCHIYNYEQGGFAQLSGAVARPVQGEFGVLRLEQLQGLIRPDNEHFVRTRLVCLENTHNRGAGKIQPYEEVERICRWAHENGLRTHLDGARLFNAAVASGIPADRWSQHFDTVSVCFSKGLGAPVGSGLAGSRELIQEARRHRKLFGGGMRQAGIIAAGALYALENHIDRLADDHANSQILAEAVRQIEGLKLEPEAVDTNIVIFRVSPELASAPELVATLKERGVLTLAIGGLQVRMVTHLDVDESAVRRAVELLRESADALRQGHRPAETGAAY
ncbi:MAG: low-specificity L-threonine aldolase [Planctomycetes bacterium]|nr:low-specificity L-threonine aldolase [Planctomycetota bacterium]